MREYVKEPVRGLPERLPAGEEILWQGEPRWWSLAKRVFHIRMLAFYCGVLLTWNVITALKDGFSVEDTAMVSVWPAFFMAVALGLLLLMAFLQARTTVYTITNQRVVMRYGVAIPRALNIPFSKINSASLKMHPDGTGDVPLELTGPDRLAYLHLWPHARPWTFNPSHPMLRAVPDAGRAAEVLADALGSTLASRNADEPGQAKGSETSATAAA